MLDHFFGSREFDALGGASPAGRIESETRLGTDGYHKINSQIPGRSPNLVMCCGCALTQFPHIADHRHPPTGARKLMQSV